MRAYRVGWRVSGVPSVKNSEFTVRMTTDSHYKKSPALGLTVNKVSTWLLASYLFSSHNVTGAILASALSSKIWHKTPVSKDLTAVGHCAEEALKLLVP